MTEWSVRQTTVNLSVSGRLVCTLKYMAAGRASLAAESHRARLIGHPLLNRRHPQNPLGLNHRPLPQTRCHCLVAENEQAPAKFTWFATRTHTHTHTQRDC